MLYYILCTCFIIIHFSLGSGLSNTLPEPIIPTVYLHDSTLYIQDIFITSGEQGEWFNLGLDTTL